MINVANLEIVLTLDLGKVVLDDADFSHWAVVQDTNKEEGEDECKEEEGG